MSPRESRTEGIKLWHIQWITTVYKPHLRRTVIESTSGGNSIAERRMVSMVDALR